MSVGLFLKTVTGFGITSVMGTTIYHRSGVPEKQSSQKDLSKNTEKWEKLSEALCKVERVRSKPVPQLSYEEICADLLTIPVPNNGEVPDNIHALKSDRTNDFLEWSKGLFTQKKCGYSYDLDPIVQVTIDRCQKLREKLAVEITKEKDRRYPLTSEEGWKNQISQVFNAHRKN